MGGSLLGEIDISYAELCQKLGRPNQPNDGYKVDAEWLVFTEKGHASIYNYKSGKNYNGKEGLPLKEIRDWHIGGENPEVVDIVVKYLKDND